MGSEMCIRDRENSYTEIRKTYFLAPKWGSTYTRINTVVTIIGDLKFKSTLEVCMESKLPAKFGELLHP